MLCDPAGVGPEGDAAGPPGPGDAGPPEKQPAVEKARAGKTPDRPANDGRGSPGRVQPAK